MNMAKLLSEEKIISLSELQKNPSKALSGKIVRIVKNGKEMGIFMSKEQFEEFLEDFLPFTDEFEKELKESEEETKSGNYTPLKLD